MNSYKVSGSSQLSGSDGSDSDDLSSTQSESSLCSESNCFSYHTDEPTNISLSKPKRHINLLQKLYLREIRGNFSPHRRAPNLKLFNSVPAENTVRLRHVLPESAFHSNHIFLGLSKCGQFLLSYTHSVELDVIIFSNVYKYRLHWWSFVPHQRARKVAEVMLFGNQGVYCDLHISMCQWPTDTSRLLVYGCCVHSHQCQFGPSHMTITTVPSLNRCRDCQLVASSYEDEDLAAIWDSCVRFSCLKHGLTIHSNFDVVSPYPKFNPQISMKRDGLVVFNTGNFLHVLLADLEQFGGATVRRPPDETLGAFLSELDETGAGDTSGTEESWGECAPVVRRRGCVRGGKGRVAEEAGGSGEKRGRECGEGSRSLDVATELNISCVGGGEERRGRRPRAGPVKMGSPSPETVYEFTEDDPEHSEKLSSFRRRRLAEKKYEFCEEEGEDAENIVPFRLLKPQDPGPRSPDPTADVLRPLNRNVAVPREADREWAKSGARKLLQTEGWATEANAHKVTRDDAAPASRARCTVQFKRRYIEVDDELVSTTTEIEDDDCTGSAPYHFALPLEIHGAGYVQLQMISSSKADKLAGAPGVMVHQMSFDVEAFCHEVAERLCEEASKKYCFCIDYDVEIIDVCPLTGDVMVLAIMRIEAIVVTKGVEKTVRRGEGQPQRSQYQGGCTFVWHTDTGRYKIVDTSPLMESRCQHQTAAATEPWGPAKSLVGSLRKDFPQLPMCHTVRSISNNPVFADMSYKCLSDLENLIDLVL